MKTQISVPNSISEAAEKLARELGMSLDEFYIAAVVAYLGAYQNGDVTRKLDEVYSKEKSTLDPGLAAIQAASIGGQEW